MIERGVALNAICTQEIVATCTHPVKKEILSQHIYIRNEHPTKLKLRTEALPCIAEDLQQVILLKKHCR